MFTTLQPTTTALALYVPANLTNQLQLLDLTVNAFNGTEKFLRGKFQEWYAIENASQVDKGVDVYVVDISTKLSVMNPMHARLLVFLT